MERCLPAKAGGVERFHRSSKAEQQSSRDKEDDLFPPRTQTMYSLFSRLIPTDNLLSLIEDSHLMH